jgi:EAL domain-containing protein (putative c-di-GMP-specific phosphodiesterase class I)
MSALGQATQMEMLLEPGRLETVFQPVFQLQPRGRRRYHYLEALTRGPVGTNLRSAGVLFEYARRKGRAAEIDRLCVAGALRSAGRLPNAPSLGLNVHASTLERDFEFVAFLLSGAESHGLAAASLVLEIVEHSPHCSGRRFEEALRALRDAGVSVALDDIGLGHSNYRMLLDCRPDYLKIDAYITRGCHEDPGRIAVLESLVLLAEKLGARLIVEGVEQPEELALLESLGVELVQGFLRGIPQPGSRLFPPGIDARD